jgi:hypothetical protein
VEERTNTEREKDSQAQTNKRPCAFSRSDAIKTVARESFRYLRYSKFTFGIAGVVLVCTLTVARKTAPTFQPPASPHFGNLSSSSDSEEF